MAFTSMMGARITRREDPRLITGGATYVDDVKLAGMTYAAFARSPFAHAKIRSIDTRAAKASPGVFAVYTSDDLAGVGDVPVAAQLPDMKVPKHPPLARGKVAHVGEPVVMIVANAAAAARDAVDLVEIDYQELPAVVDLEQAVKGAPYVHEEFGTNVAYTMEASGGDVESAFENAAVTVSERLVNQRLAPLSMEPRGMVAHWEKGPQQLTLWSSTQIPHLLRTQIAGLVGIPEHKVRTIAPEVGGGFGSKLEVYAEEIACSFASRALGMPVKYVETRSESFMIAVHGRDQIDYIHVAADKHGKITGLKVEILANMGAYYQLLTPGIPTFTVLMAPGPYTIENVHCKLTGIFTTEASTDAYRGAGRPEATYLIERAVDLVARKLGMDPAEVRRRNFIPKEKFPYTTALGLTYDTGDYHAAFDKALQLAGYAELRKEQERARAEGRIFGIGISSYVEVCGMGPSSALPAPGWGSATVRVEPTGRVTVMTGASPHGQGEETTFAQMVSDRLGVPIDDVLVLHGDSAIVQYGIGTFGSRSTAVDGAALYRALDTVREKAMKIAAHTMEANVADLEFKNGKITVKGNPQKSTSIGEVAFAAFRGINLPPDMEPGLEATRRFEPPNFVYPFGTHVCVVEIERATGAVEVVKYVAVDDCGNIINPLIVEGQVHGGIAQGLAQALFEEVVYDENGQLATGSLLQYAAPHADQVPHYQTGHTVTPTDVNPMGVKGVGEAGTIGSTPAVVNAVVDALAPFGVVHLDMPCKPERVWRALNAHEGNGKAGRR
ncbi:MAG TPA: molybdopterin cofactor-binding domain-containing protein [Candidatus Dormibacteraeota bacterium]|nr:molybdopterin cofactor-binding domain-containing protein [Candidatus Dormibacteraeota bacterium]